MLSVVSSFDSVILTSANLTEAEVLADRIFIIEDSFVTTQSNAVKDIKKRYSYSF